MGRLGRILDKAYDRLLSICNAVATTVMFLVLLLIVADVIERYFFTVSIHGTFEIAKHSLPLIVFLAIAYTQRHGGHIRTGVILDRLPGRRREILNMLANLMGLIAFALIFWFTSKMAWMSLITREFYQGLIPMPMYPSRTAVALGSLLVVIQFAIQLGQGIRTVCRHQGVAS